MLVVFYIIISLAGITTIVSLVTSIWKTPKVKNKEKKEEQHSADEKKQDNVQTVMVLENPYNKMIN